MLNQDSGNTKAGTVGGTILVVLLQMDIHEIINTALVAAVGAVVSFTMSVLLKYLSGRFRRK